MSQPKFPKLAGSGRRRALCDKLLAGVLWLRLAAICFVAAAGLNVVFRLGVDWPVIAMLSLAVPLRLSLFTKTQRPG